MPEPVQKIDQKTVRNGFVNMLMDPHVNLKFRNNKKFQKLLDEPQSLSKNLLNAKKSIFELFDSLSTPIAAGKFVSIGGGAYCSSTRPPIFNLNINAEADTIQVARITDITKKVNEQFSAGINNWPNAINRYLLSNGVPRSALIGAGNGGIYGMGTPTKWTISGTYSVEWNNNKETPWVLESKIETHQFGKLTEIVKFAIDQMENLSKTVPKA